jgi:hypothetical protein
VQGNGVFAGCDPAQASFAAAYDRAVLMAPGVSINAARLLHMPEFDPIA